MDGREQLAVVLWRDDDGWKLSADVGVRGLEHARRMNTQTFEIEEPLAAALLSTTALALAPADADLAQSVYRYFDREAGA